MAKVFTVKGGAAGIFQSEKLPAWGWMKEEKLRKYIEGVFSRQFKKDQKVFRDYIQTTRPNIANRAGRLYNSLGYEVDFSLTSKGPQFRYSVFSTASHYDAVDKGFSTVSSDGGFPNFSKILAWVKRRKILAKERRPKTARGKRDTLDKRYKRAAYLVSRALYERESYPGMRISDSVGPVFAASAIDLSKTGSFGWTMIY